VLLILFHYSSVLLHSLVLHCKLLGGKNAAQWEFFAAQWKNNL